jgi:hypothetical protein
MSRGEESLNGVPPRQAQAAQTVARRLIAIGVGERIPTVAALAAESGTGAGTVQAALRMLEDAGAVSLSSHGHQGTRVEARDPGRLWTFAAGGALVGILPLPTSPEFTGLATALADAFESHGVPASLTFRHGAHHRLRLLETGRADFLVASVAFADSLPAEGFHTIALPPYTYFQRDSVVVITRAGETPAAARRIAVDRDSADHSTLTEAEFAGRDLLEAPTSQIPELIVRGDADAAVWHESTASPLMTATGLAIHPLSRPSPAAGERFSRAALVMAHGEDRSAAAPAALLGELLNVDALAAVQREVIERRRVPSF